MSLTKKSFVLRIEEESFTALAKWAEDDFRSVNGQIEMILDKALKEVGRKKEAIVLAQKKKVEKNSKINA